MGNSENLIIGPASFEIKNPWTASAWSDLGYTLGGVEAVDTLTLTPIRPRWSRQAVDDEIEEESLSIRTTLAEGTKANLAAALAGSSLSSNTITLGGANLVKFGLRLTGKNPAGFDRVLTIPFGQVIGPTRYFMGKAISSIPFVFLARKRFGYDFATIVDSTS